MKILLVDDEPLALDILENYICREPELEIVARCYNAIEAFDALKEHKVDLMFLDIQMPQISGIDFLKALANPPKVIFTTAFPNYALQGYELNVVDYLLKPIPYERFAKAMEKVRALILPTPIDTKPNDTENTSIVFKENEPEDYIFVKANKKLIKIHFDEIYYIEGLKDYVIIHISEKRIITLQTMKMLEQKLPSENFKRVHRSYIINTNYIQQADGSHVMIQKKRIPLGRSYKDELLKELYKKKL